MRLYLLIFFFGISIFSYSQEKVRDIKGSFGKLKHSFNIEDEQTGNLAIFLEGNNRLFTVLYNKEFDELGRIVAPDISSKYQSVVGYQSDGKNISLLMNTLNGKNYGLTKFDFQTGFATSQELDFTIKGERVLDAVNYKNNIYLFTLPKSSSQINIYSFKNITEPTLIELKFEEADFLDRKNKGRRLVDVVKESQFITVEVDAPNSLEVASRKFKMYQNDANVIFTVDSANEFTYVINVNLDSFEKSVTRLEKPTIDGFKMGLRTNSFVDNNQLFQLVANSDILKLRVFDLSSKEIIKEYFLTDDDELYIKNTPIVQQGGDFQAYRELETTNQFLRKISTGNIGLSLYKSNGIYQLTMGSTVENEGGASIVLGGALGGIVGVIIVSSINQLTASYANYKNTKSVKITGLFDEDLSHIQGEVPENPFDTIQSFLEENDGQAETIFRKNNQYYLGYFNKKDEIYSIYKF